MSGLRRLAAGALLGVLLALLVPAPAQAHATLIGTDPPAGAVLADGPAAIRLAFTETVRPVAERIRVIGPDQSRADAGGPRVDGAELTIGLKSGLARGTYLVTYRVISADSHPVAGSFTFSVGSPSVQPPTADEAAGPVVDPAVAVALGVANWLGYAGLVLLAGPLLFLARLWPMRLSRRTPARLVAAGLFTVMISTVAEMYLQGPHSAGTGLFGASGEALSAALSGGYGATHIVRLAVLGALAVMVRPFLRPAGPSGVDRAGVAFVALIGLGTWPLSGHAAVSPVPALSTVSDAAHLAAMAGWLGGLLLLVTVLLRRATRRELAAILPVWSSWAMVAVATVAMTGSAQAIIEVQAFDALFGTRYGRLVLAKLGLLAVVVAVAWFARRLVGRIAAGDDQARPAAGLLRRTVLAELGVTAVVLGLAAGLVQTPPARTAGDAPSVPYTVTVTGELFTVRLEVTPAEVGGNSLHLYAFDRQGAPQSVQEWKVTAEPADRSLEALTVPVLPMTEDHAVAEPNFPVAGEWELRMTLRISEVDQATVSHRLKIT